MTAEKVRGEGVDGVVAMLNNKADALDRRYHGYSVEADSLIGKIESSPVRFPSRAARLADLQRRLIPKTQKELEDVRARLDGGIGF